MHFYWYIYCAARRGGNGRGTLDAPQSSRSNFTAVQLERAGPIVKIKSLHSQPPDSSFSKRSCAYCVSLGPKIFIFLAINHFINFSYSFYNTSKRSEINKKWMGKECNLYTVLNSLLSSVHIHITIIFCFLSGQTFF